MSLHRDAKPQVTGPDEFSARTGEDLSVAFVAGRDQPSQTADDQVTEGCDEVHWRRTYRPVEQLETPRNAAAMDFRHLQAPCGDVVARLTVGQCRQER